jgi:hypothetical protein
MQAGRTRKLVIGLTAGIAAALVAVPVGQAKLTVDARHQALVDKAKVSQVTPEEKIVMMHRHAAHLYLNRHVASKPQAQVSTLKSGGIDWSDAFVGASAGFGLALLAGGSVLITRRRLVEV